MAIDFKKTLGIGEAVPVEELVKKPSAGRQPSERDLALIDFVKFVGEKENADKAFPWKFDGKPLTARAAAIRAIERAELNDVVFVSSKEGQLWFSQTKLSNRGRKAK